MLLIIGCHSNNYLEGYARILLRYLQLHVSLTRNCDCYFINVKDHFSPHSISMILNDLLRSSRISQLRYTSLEIPSIHSISPLLQVLATLSIKKVVNPSYTIYGGLPVREYLLFLAGIDDHESLNLLTVYSRNHFYGLLKILKSLRNLRKYPKIVVLNPYWNGRVGNATFIKTLYPPLDPLLLNSDSKFTNIETVEDTVVFRFMGRYHKSRGIMELIRAFRKFKNFNPRAKAKLIIDALNEASKSDLYIKIGEDIEVTIANPYMKGLTPAHIIKYTLEKYMKSSYIVLPYRYWQFVEPPLTLMEALATGSYIVTTTLLKPYINEKIAYIVDNDNNFEHRLVKAFEYLYEIYGGKEYLVKREMVKIYAKNIFNEIKDLYKKILNSTI